MQRILFFTAILLLNSFPLLSQVKSDHKQQVYPTGNKINLNQNKSSTCGETSEGTIPLIDCDDIGTAAYNTNSLVSTVDYTTTSLISGPSCWNGTEYAGNWSVYDLSPGGTSLMVEVESFGTYFYNDIFWLSFYQGDDCSSLTEIHCEDILVYSGGWYSSEIIVEGLDPSKKLWIYSSSDDYFDLDIRLRGMSTPSNTSCVAGVGQNAGCNVGANGDTDWTGPSLADIVCSGTDCGWTINLYDQQGGNWGVGYVDVRVDGSSVGTYTYSGVGSSYDFDVTPEASVSVIYYPGSNNNKNYFSLTDPDGSTIYTSSLMGNSISTVITYDAYCTHTWYSNENTVYYTFTATNESATLDINNVICNDGTVGEAQFGVWKDCGDVGDYSGASSFMGCAVGSGTLTMPTLDIGETYILAVDGQAGDICNWDFVTAGVQLPTELINLKATSFNGFNRVSWLTESERNSDYFIVQKSIDGKIFFDLDIVESAGNSQSTLDYYFDDQDQQMETVYYRLKQVDLDGKFEFHGPKILRYSGESALTVIPNPVSGIGTVNYPFKNKTNYSIAIIDMSGRVVKNELFIPTSVNAKFDFNSEELESGLYFLRISDQSGIVDQVNFVK